MSEPQTPAAILSVDDEANALAHQPLVKLLLWLVLVSGLAATYFLQQSAFNDARRILQGNFTSRTGEITLRIEQRLAAYEQVLRGVKGLYAASKSVERDEFRDYANILRLQEQYPGIQGVGYSQIVPPQEKAAHIEAIRKEGFPGYSIKPEGERDLYTSIIYLEPFSGRNLRAFGYDMYSEAVRRAAMEQARDLDKSVMSGKVTLVQEEGQNVQAGFLIYLPVYRNGSPHETLADRRANILGWVYAPFRMNDLMPGVLGEQANNIDYEIYDGENVNLDALMYDNDGHLSRHQTNTPLFQTRQRIKAIGHTWTIELRSLPALEASIDTGRVKVLWGAGILMSALLYLLVWQLSSGRARALKLAQGMTRKLRDSEARLTQTLISAELGTWDWNVKTGHIVFDERWARMRGYQPDEVKPDASFWEKDISPGDSPLFQQKLSDHLAGNSAIFDAEYRACTKSGSWIWLMDRGTVIERDGAGKPLRMVGIEMNVTERKKIEEELRVTVAKLEEAHNQLLQSEKMASIGQLAAGVAHEINNPIGYVYSNLGTLEKYVQDTFAMLEQYEQAEGAITDPGVRARLQAARKKLDIAFLKDDLSALMGESKDGITRVKKIVQNLKDFSHVDVSDEWHFSDLHNGLDSTLNIVNNEIKYKAEVVKEYGGIPEVECLSSQLNQVFMNLLVNAAHAIEERGTITIRTGTIRTGKQGEEVWVEVADTGKGIPAENMKKIFDPFFTTKPIGKGTGLGLSLSYGIIQKHHGRIEVQSEVGKGTTFRVWLPVKQAEETH